MDRIKKLPFFLNSIFAVAMGGGLYKYHESVDAFLQYLNTDLDLKSLLMLLGGAGVPAGIYGWFRRVRTTGRVDLGQYFENPDYSNFPRGRKGYSDRLSYTLAELSDLAYWDVHDEAYYNGLTALAGIEDKEEYLNLKEIAKLHLAIGKETTQERFDEALERGGFKPIQRLIRSGETQCFVCVYDRFGYDQTHQPYIVVAFRGSEKKVDDWLTNANAVPASEFNLGPVHQGFYLAYKSVQQQVLDAINVAKAQYGQETPVFFTGHSLGGALAVIATRLDARDTNGACYTFGCPRVGGYAFFKGMKTPVYRVVNSSDLVPEVPPGVWSHLLLGLLSILKYFTARWEALSGFFESAKGLIDKINDYRHYGDLRYLPDLPSSKIEDKSKHISELQILSNPNRFDVIQWFFRHILVSFGMPVKSHSMKLYRNKLLKVANNRMKEFDVG